METPRIVYLLILGLVLGVSLFSLYRGRLNQALQAAAIWTLIFMGATLAFALREPLMVALNLQSESSGEMLALPRHSGHFVARADVNGTPVNFIVDTGASQIVLSRTDAARVGLGPDDLAFTGTAQTANGSVATSFVTLDSFELGPFTDRSVGATVNSGAMDVSLLGMAYLDRFARISVEGDRMILER
ncbi:MAG: TIGR02281 family clan AA aspartic protease [Pseudomonadota bacterium]